MNEIVFIIKEDSDGKFTARSAKESIFTEGDDLDSLKINIREAVSCHYGGEKDTPKVIKLHFVKEEIMAV